MEDIFVPWKLKIRILRNISDNKLVSVVAVVSSAANAVGICIVIVTYLWKF